MIIEQEVKNSVVGKCDFEMGDEVQENHPLYKKVLSCIYFIRRNQEIPNASWESDYRRVREVGGSHHGEFDYTIHFHGGPSFKIWAIGNNSVPRYKVFFLYY